MRKISTLIIAAIAAILQLTSSAQAQAPQGNPTERTTTPAPAAAPAPATKAAPAPKATKAPARYPIGKVTWDKVAGNWKRFKGSIRKQWGRLTDNEVQIAKGNREALNGYIQARYSIDREKADRQIDDWLKTLK